MRSKISLLILVILVWSRPQLAQAQQINCNRADSLVLIELYNSLNKPNTPVSETWNLQEPVYYWDGIELDGTGRVKSINSPYFGGGSGPLPSSLGNLTNLTFLDLAGCGVTGSIPSNIGTKKVIILTHLILLTAYVVNTKILKKHAPEKNSLS